MITAMIITTIITIMRMTTVTAMITITATTMTFRMCTARMVR